MERPIESSLYVAVVAAAGAVVGSLPGIWLRSPGFADTTWRFVFAMGLGAGGVAGAIIGAVSLVTEPYRRRPRGFAIGVTLLGAALGSVPGLWFRNPEMGDITWRQVFAIGMSAGAIVGAIAGVAPIVFETVWRGRGPR